MLLAQISDPLSLFATPSVMHAPLGLLSLCMTKIVLNWRHNYYTVAGYVSCRYAGM